MSLEDRLKAGLEQCGQCLVWTKATNKQGYGKIATGFNKWELTHRIAFKFANGYLPDDKVVMHTCDNPPCCNPEHLKLGTYADNNKDCADKGRHNKPKGSDHGRAILTDSQVLDIRNRYKTEKITQRGLAKEFGVSKSLIGAIIRNEKWTHL